MSELPFWRRVYGIESEYGICCTLHGRRRLTPDEVARYLFRLVVEWGRSANVFMENGARMYLDVGSHPEYSTPECDNLTELVTHDKAGERILEGLVHQAQKRLAWDGISGQIYLFKNNTDSHGNSYGCHENYMISRFANFQQLVDVLVPFLITRQIYQGAGKLVKEPTGAVRYVLSQRAAHIWEPMSSATTRSRPLINTRDEPHADAEKYRRLHIIAADTNMNEFATWLKVGTVAVILTMLECQRGFRDLSLAVPIRALRKISDDPSCQTRVRLCNGRELSALEIQWEYCERAIAFSQRADLPPELTQVVKSWEQVLSDLEQDPMRLADRVDWVAKYQLINRYRDDRRLAPDDPRLHQLDLAYHNVDQFRGLYYLLAKRGLVKRVSTDQDISQAIRTPPPHTRAHLRGRFVKAAYQSGRDVTVDWVHLKVNDSSQRTILCKDPLIYEDERVNRLIASFGPNSRPSHQSRRSSAALGTVPSLLGVGENRLATSVGEEPGADISGPGSFRFGTRPPADYLIPSGPNLDQR